MNCFANASGSYCYNGVTSLGFATCINYYNSLIQTCANMGITLFSSSGDAGGVSGASQVGYPESSPWAVAVGDTTLHCASPTPSGPCPNETAWSGSGGGYSSFNGPSTDQIPTLTAQSLPTTYRAFPDVSANADPSSGYVLQL